MRSIAYLIGALFALMLPICASAGEALAPEIAAMVIGRDAGDANADLQSERVYRPIQALSYVLASKMAIGYFSREAGRCNVTLMVAEVVDLDLDTPLSAARLRLSLTPGQSAALDSEEGPSIELTCDTEAETLTVLENDRTLQSIAQAR